MGRVAGKVAIVTGGAQGLGKADCEALVREGAQVMITDIKVAEGEALAQALNAVRANSAVFMQQDVRDEARWQEVIAATVARFGKLNVLVNNAGMVIPATPESTTLEQFRLHSAIMSEATFLGCKHATGRRRLHHQYVLRRDASRLSRIFCLLGRERRRARHDQVDRGVVPNAEVQHPLQLGASRRH
jgi:NAD(P)-dependent dehydrogenase (short-subunit alcohol dehydrogenase family)